LQNASLDFDPVTLTPTYNLTVGVPGGSNALATASRLGLHSDIINGAREMLSEGSQELESLLTDLVSQKNTVEALRHDLEKELWEAQRSNTELKNQLQRLTAEERRIIQESRDRVVRQAAELQKEIRQVSSQLRKQKTKEAVEQSRKALSSVHEKLRSDAWQAKAGIVTEGEQEPDASIARGDTVWLKEANLPATVLSVSQETQQVEVQAGSTKINLSLDGVEKIAPSSVRREAGYTPTVSQPPAPRVSPELHLRGKRADEVEWALNNYLDSACLAGLNEVRIVHGTGTGVLRSVVRELLASHPLVKSYRPGRRGEGGDGATVASL